MVWNKTFGGAQTEGVDFCIDTSDGGYLIGGHTQSYGNGEDDYYIIKLNAISQEPEPLPELPASGIPGFYGLSIAVGLIVAIIFLSRFRR